MISRTTRFAELAAYDPSSDSWRSLARPPQVASVSPPVAYLDGRLSVLSLGGTVDGEEVGSNDQDYNQAAFTTTRQISGCLIPTHRNVRNKRGSIPR